MYGIILLLSGLFLVKSILLNEFYSNNLIFSMFPLELAAVSLYNDELSSHITAYTRWILIGWLGLNNEHTVLNDIMSIDENEYIIICCWMIAFTFYQIYYIIREKYIKHNKLSKWSFYAYNLKFSMINYVSLYLWNLNTLVHVEDSKFWFILINLLIFNAITFWFPGILFNFIYGDKMYLYRIKYSFLIDEFNLKYKYFTIILLALKAISGLYIIFYNFWEDGSKYLLWLVLGSYLLICYKINIFKRKGFTREILYEGCISFLIIFLSTIEYYYPDNIEFIIFKIILFACYICLLVYFIIHEKKNKVIEKTTNDKVELVEMDTFTISRRVSSTSINIEV